MKFLMNGCLLLATADGSTVEIIEEIGEENMVISILNEVYKFTLGNEILFGSLEDPGHGTYHPHRLVMTSLRVWILFALDHSPTRL